MWANQDDEIFHADAGCHTVTRHAPTGEVLLTLGTRGQIGAPGAPFNRPTHAVQAPNGDIIVSDGYGQNRIHRFSASGRAHPLLRLGNVAFGSSPPASRPRPGLNVPHDVVVDRDSQLIVSDRENHRLQFFTLDGEFVSMFAVTHPNKVLIDPDGVLHIGGGAGVEVWTKDGTRLGGGARRERSRASSCQAASTASGWTARARSTPQRPASTTASRSSHGSDPPAPLPLLLGGADRASATQREARPFPTDRHGRPATLTPPQPGGRRRSPPRRADLDRGVSMVFGEPGAGNVVRALQDVSLEIGRRELVSLIGPSGCGKSTLLRADRLTCSRRLPASVLVNGKPATSPYRPRLRHRLPAATSSTTGAPSTRTCSFRSKS